MRPYRLFAYWIGFGLLFGCAKEFRHEREAQLPADPAETLPEWAYDAPCYFRPPSEAAPKPVGSRDPDFPRHYYVRDRVILIDRPLNNVEVDRAPRIAVWWTDTNGCLWSRGGFFGLGQTHFALVAGDDGDYGVRFTGPGIRESLTPQTLPHRIYHIDRQPPYVVVSITPDCPIYNVGDVIDVHWCAADRWLDDDPVRLAICWSWENPDLVLWHEGRTEPGERAVPDDAKEASRLWQPFEEKFPAEGEYRVAVPEFAVGEAFQVQVRAKDRSGNYGYGYTKPILVNGESLPAEPSDVPATQPATEPTAPADLQAAAPAEQPPTKPTDRQ